MVLSLVLITLSCDAPTAVPDGVRVVWLWGTMTGTILEGAGWYGRVEIEYPDGRQRHELDGATLSLRFTSPVDTQPASSCGAACTAIFAQGRADLNVAWVSAGTWTVSACMRSSVAADSACARMPLTVLPIHAALVVFPADSVARRAHFAVEAQLRMPDGSPISHLAPAVRLRFSSSAPAAGHVRCPEAGPSCERTPVAGVVRLDSVMVLDTAATTLEACVVAPNGRERCDPAGPRAFRVSVPRVTLSFVTAPSGGAAGVPFATQPVVEALEPDGTRRTDFADLVTLTLGAGGPLGPVLAGTAHGGATTRGTVTVRAVAGAATLPDLRVNQVGAGYTLVAAAAGAVSDTSAAFDVPLDGTQLMMTVLRGDNQYAQAGSLLPIAPAVRVTGPLGDSIAAVVVSFEVRCYLGSGCSDADIAQLADTTDLAGVATSGQWRVALAVGSQQLVASVAGLADVTFTASGIFATRLVFVTGPSSIVAGDTMRPAVVVELQDDQGRRAFGAMDTVGLLVRNNHDAATVLGTSWRALLDGRATFEDLSVTKADTWVMGVGSTTLFIQWSDSFFVAPRADTVHLGLVTGNGQTVIAGQSVDTLPTVRVTDGYGNEVPGHTVSFAATLGGGSVTGGVQVTDSRGLARPDAWTLGPFAGFNTLQATADRSADSVTFFATGTQPSFYASSVSAGWDFTCATTLTTNLPYCWGANTYSQLGEGTQTARSRPTQLAGALLQLTQVSAGQDFACGLTAAGAAYCWGKNWYGQLGIDTFDVVQHATPEAVAGGHTFQQISVGALHACALDTGGVAWCWGSGSTGAIGGASLSTHPWLVNTTLRFTQIDVGALHSCALTASGDIWCWGSNDYGQLGNNVPTQSFSFVPVMVTGGRSYSQVSAGGWTTCGISVSAVYCWGRNREGQVGNGTTSPGWEYVPVHAQLTLGSTVSITVGTTHACSLNSLGETYCWGANTHGELGDGTTIARLTGTPISGGLLFIAITAGLNHTCGFRQSGGVYCWGLNGSGRLGDGTLIQRTVPVQVLVP